MMAEKIDLGGEEYTWDTLSDLIQKIASTIQSVEKHLSVKMTCKLR